MNVGHTKLYRWTPKPDVSSKNNYFFTTMRLFALRSEKQWVFGIFDPIDMQKTFDT